MISLGQTLKEERIKKDLTLDEIEKELKIKSDFLLDIENGDYHKLPKGAYAAGFVRNYIQFLGLSEEKLMALFRREFNQEKNFKVLPEGFSKTEEFPIKRFKLKPSAILLFLLFLLILGYLLFQYRFAFISPPLNITAPKENSVIRQKTITVFGNTDPSVNISVNNQAVSIDEDGNFKKTLNLFPGKETITVKAVNRFGKETIVKRQIEVSY